MISEILLLSSILFVTFNWQLKKYEVKSFNFICDIIIHA